MARKNWIKQYMEYTRFSEAPDVFHFWTAISTLGGALRRRVWIDQGEYQWVPNFYIIFVAPAGIATKSTTINIGMSMLKEIPGIHWGPDSGTWQAMADRLAESSELVPVHPGHLETDTLPMSCITCAIGELGTFLDFTDRKLIDVLTSLWDAQLGSFEHSTKTTGSTLIENPWINMIGATTPAWLKANVSDTIIGGGFASRVVFVFGSKKRKLVAYPGLARDRKVSQALRKELVTDLEHISGLIGEMQIAPEVEEYGKLWYEEHWNNRPIHMASDRYDGYRARKQTHIHKLAMVLSLAKSDKLVLELDSLIEAEQMVTAMEQDMINVFESIGIASSAQLFQKIAAFISVYQDKGIAVDKQILTRYCMQYMNQREYTETLAAAIQAGYLEVKAHQGNHYYRLLVRLEEIGKDTVNVKKQKAPALI